MLPDRLGIFGREELVDVRGSLELVDARGSLELFSFGSITVAGVMPRLCWGGGGLASNFLRAFWEPALMSAIICFVSRVEDLALLLAEVKRRGKDPESTHSWSDFSQSSAW
jgi:hypothetical protein